MLTDICIQCRHLKLVGEGVAVIQSVTLTFPALTHRLNADIKDDFLLCYDHRHRQNVDILPEACTVKRQLWQEVLTTHKYWDV